ncbi:interferon-induced protein 44-like [Ruditapes philippinarum]|uniref:interferon-induced protein 44-like n=1 Tax=Ruditapes philippinarum TaxID=129788 RepID=UPI00295BCE39|nr:interferon-induced protein 44-like [Ruditapes philippinarum]
MLKFLKSTKKHNVTGKARKESIKPWREFEPGGSWTEQYRTKLLEQINLHNIEEEGVATIRILLLGQIKAGKSSFLNTVAAIDRKRISQITRAGGADKSLTFALKEYRPTGALKKNICILDTMGYEEGKAGFNAKDVGYLVNGHICPDYKFHPTSHIEKESTFFRPNPQKGDKVNCIVFVADANILGQDNITMEIRQKQKELHDELSLQDVPTIVLLTKIDVLCESVETDVTNAYTSEKVKQAVDKAEEFYNVPKQNIFPVKNYEKEIGTDINTEILVLLALRQMMYFGTDFLNAASGSAAITE